MTRMVFPGTRNSNTDSLAVIGFNVFEDRAHPIPFLATFSAALAIRTARWRFFGSSARSSINEGLPLDDSTFMDASADKVKDTIS